MKITIEDINPDEFSNKTTIEEDSVDIHDVIDMLARALLAYGFHPESVRDGFYAKVDEYENDKPLEQGEN